MVGRAIHQRLLSRGAKVLAPTHDELNLLRKEKVEEYFFRKRPTIAIHAAGWNGGIEWNRLYPAQIFYNTTQMALNVLSCIPDYGVKKGLTILASCSFPDNGSSVLDEDSLWDGLPNSTVECHGLAKRMMHAYSRQIYKQYNTPIISCVLTNSYGPYDSFHPQKTKVVGALIKKFVDAVEQRQEEVICWGDGSPLREFMYCEDAGEMIVRALECYNDPMTPLNIGSGIEVSIKELTVLIAYLVGYTGKITWDTTKSNGQMRKLLDSSRMAELLGRQNTKLSDGLTKTIAYYKEHKCEMSA